MSGDGTSNTSPPADPEPASGWGDVPTSSDSAWGDSLGGMFENDSHLVHNIHIFHIS